MDPQAFDRNRRTFILAAAVLAAGGALSCEQPQGLKRSRSSKPLEGGEAGASGATGASGASSDAAKTTPPGGNAAKQSSANTAKQGAEAAKADGTTPKPPAPPVERPLPPTTEPAIRVKSGGLPKSDPKIRIDGPGAHLWIIEPGNAQPGTVGQSPVEFRWTDAGWKATEAAGTSRARPLALPARATLEIMALRDEPQRLKLSGATSIADGKESEWPGTVRLVPQPTDPNEPVDVVHEVPMETYLPGVLAQELFNKWTVNVHRAQAVAARSWALCEMEMWRTRRHFDAVAGEQGQAWIGATAVALWGNTEATAGADSALPEGYGADGTSGNQPRHNVVAYNLCRELGVWEKQSSCWFQAKAALTELVGNVCFNGGRAGFNFNVSFVFFFTSPAARGAICESTTTTQRSS